MYLLILFTVNLIDLIIDMWNILHMRYIWDKSVKLNLIIFFVFDFFISIALGKMPRQRLFTRSILTRRPINMTLNLECTEEPLSEAQLISKTKLKEDYDRVSIFTKISFFRNIYTC